MATRASRRCGGWAGTAVAGAEAGGEFAAAKPLEAVAEGPEEAGRFEAALAPLDERIEREYLSLEPLEAGDLTGRDGPGTVTSCADIGTARPPTRVRPRSHGSHVTNRSGSASRVRSTPLQKRGPDIDNHPFFKGFIPPSAVASPPPTQAPP